MAVIVIGYIPICTFMQAIFVFHFLTKHVIIILLCCIILQIIKNLEQNSVNSFGVHREHSSRQEILFPFITKHIKIIVHFRVDKITNGYEI